MKTLLQEYATYNVWANKTLFERILKLSDEQIHQEITSSFPSIYKTVLHLWYAEDVWWQRLKLAENIEPAALKFNGSFNELVKLLAIQSKQWEDWVHNATDNQINHVFAYQNSKKEQFKQPMYQTLQHLFNHGSYHRGQLVTMLRQLGVTDIPLTDFIIFSRTKR